MIIKRFTILLAIIISGAVLILLIFLFLFLSKEQASAEFSGQRAYEDVKYQVGLGPRTMGSVAHDQAASWIISELQKQKWQVDSQETVIFSQTVKNIIAQRG